MAEPGCEAVEHWGWVGGFLGAGLEEKACYDSFPVVAHEHELVFEEIDEGTLVLAFSEEVAVVVEGDFGR